MSAYFTALESILALYSIDPNTLARLKFKALKIIDGVKSIKAMFYMVYGNDGFDCIADHSVNDVTDQIMSVINPICDKWESKLI